MLHWTEDSRKVLPCPHPVVGQTKLPDAQAVFAAWDATWANACSVDFVVVGAVPTDQFVKLWHKGAAVDPQLLRHGEPPYGPSY